MTLFVQGQIPGDVHLTHSKLDSKRLERAAEIFQEAKQKAQKAVDLYESIPAGDSAMEMDKYKDLYVDAFKELRQASEDYRNAVNIVNTVYKNGADDFWKEQEEKNHYATGLEKAKYYEAQARKRLSESHLMRNKIAREGDFEMALKLHNQAQRLEALALRNRGRALQIYQDFPIEYDYAWSDDIDIDSVLAQRQKAREERNKKLFAKHAKEPSKQDSIEMESDTVAVEEESIVPIIFKVQIAAHTIPIDKKDLRNIYNGKYDVNEIQESGWYKYQIGNYLTFNEAKKVLEEVNVPRAFIVAYQDGEKISVNKAKEIAP